jgi:hypothetical protein
VAELAFPTGVGTVAGPAASTLPRVSGDGPTHASGRVTLLGEPIAVRLVIKEDQKGQFHYDHTVHEAEAVFDAVGTKENGTQSAPFPAATSDDGGTDRSRFASDQLDASVLDSVETIKGRMVVNVFIQGETMHVADDVEAGVLNLANASPAANALLSVAAEVVGTNAHRTGVAINELAALLGLTVSVASRGRGCAICPLGTRSCPVLSRSLSAIRQSPGHGKAGQHAVTAAICAVA